MDTIPFSIGQTTWIAATNTSQNVVIDSLTPYPNPVARVVVTNGNVYVRFTDNASDIAIAGTDMQMLAGTVETFSKLDLHRMVIVADTTATVCVTVGAGM
jgi:hypothetical protein